MTRFCECFYVIFWYLPNNDQIVKNHSQWGMNIVSAEGDVWRKHRRIMGPAFNNKVSVISLIL